MSARTGRGQVAAVPRGFYSSPSVEPGEEGSPVVRFAGEDGRERVFRFAELPLAALHADLAAAFAARVGPGGGRRTQRAATAQWQTLRLFLVVLAGLADPPLRVEELRIRHLERHRLTRLQTCSEKTARKNLQDLMLVLRELPAARLDPALLDYLWQRGHGLDVQSDSRPGYSDRELSAIVAAARSDVAAIRDRIAAGERLLTRFTQEPGLLTDAERKQAEQLADMARTGHVRVDYRDIPFGEQAAARSAAARQLFVVDADLAPLMVYAAALTGRNPETLKELPAQHRVLEGQAVALTVTKRRRGKANALSTVHWSTAADPQRQLSTPGSFYLLLHQLMARSRAFSGTSSVWSIWAGTGRGRYLHVDTAGHIGPFDAELARKLKLGDWARRHGLVDDAGAPLELLLTRIRKTVEVRTAKAVGGHLPSARLTNTAETSYAHYLRHDPFITEWAAEVLTDAITDAEQHARTVAVHPANPQPERVPEHTWRQAHAGELDTLVTSCLDITTGPDGGGQCRESFLTCLHCPNALVLERHLPALLALQDRLQADLDRYDAEHWARRHGQTWQIITTGILPRFSAAQRAAAAQHKPTLPLDLLDGPREAQ
ncbi:hypothetical protein [Saccharopolyspora endophytica]|uniref:Uncharacterized protein n=1 Tax=Saccharopolyspora endophytica TaxID=543886 RepID=A0ABS5DMP5_9PSEU|nr:hypothetical protein [Saccharopolyspora endophytica]MBQ0927542.1 hypothetical protein [Saccharopolyspora endophytica]